MRTDERPRILVVDDEPNLREMLEIGLTQHGFDVHVVADGQAALASVREWRPDAVILDVMMPKIDGISLLPMLRRITEAPVLMLSAKVEIESRLAGLANGADDYLAKPFELRELALRLRTRLRRPQLAHPERLAVDDLEIDLQMRTTVRAGAAIELSAREFDLLAVLMRQPGRVFTRDQLIDWRGARTSRSHRTRWRPTSLTCEPRSNGRHSPGSSTRSVVSVTRCAPKASSASPEKGAPPPS